MSWDVDVERLAAWKGFLRAYRAVFDVLEDELREECGLPLTWYDVLVQLSEAPEGRLKMQDLRGRCCSARAG